MDNTGVPSPIEREVLVVTNQCPNVPKRWVGNMTRYHNLAKLFKSLVKVGVGKQCYNTKLYKDSSLQVAIKYDQNEAK